MPFACALPFTPPLSIERLERSPCLSCTSRLALTGHPSSRVSLSRNWDVRSEYKNIGGAQPTTFPPTLITLMQSPLPITTPRRHIPTRNRLPTKKALLVGISYHKTDGENPLSTSISNVKQFATFLKGGYSISPSILSHLLSPFMASRA